jgi:hypothetical protein
MLAQTTQNQTPNSHPRTHITTNHRSKQVNSGRITGQSIGKSRGRTTHEEGAPKETRKKRKKRVRSAREKRKRRGEQKEKLTSRRDARGKARFAIWASTGFVVVDLMGWFALACSLFTSERRACGDVEQYWAVSDLNRRRRRRRRKEKKKKGGKGFNNGHKG